MQRLHGNEGGKTKQIQQAMFPPQKERLIQYLVQQIILLIRGGFPPCPLQPWHIKLVIIIIIILYLQCGFNALSLRLVDTVDWSLFFRFSRGFFSLINIH